MAPFSLILLSSYTRLPVQTGLYRVVCAAINTSFHARKKHASVSPCHGNSRGDLHGTWLVKRKTLRTFKSCSMRWKRCFSSILQGFPGIICVWREQIGLKKGKISRYRLSQKDGGFRGRHAVRKKEGAQPNFWVLFLRMTWAEGRKIYMASLPR